MKDYTPASPVFSDTIREVETSDPAHADNINAAPEQLIANDMVLWGQLRATGFSVVNGKLCITYKKEG